MPDNKQLNCIIAVYVVVMFCGLIHPFHYHPLRNYYHDLIAVSALVAGIGCFAWRPSIELHVPRSTLLPIGLLLIVVLQLVSGMLLQPSDSFYPIVDFVCLALAIVFGATIAASPGAVEKLCAFIAVAWIAYGLVSVIFQHVQLVGLDAWPFILPALDRHALRPYGNLGQPNLMALHLSWGLVATWWMYSTSRLRKETAVVIALLLLWGVTLTQSRVMWITIPVIALGLAVGMPGYRVTRKSVLLALVIAFAVMVQAAPHLTAMMGVPIPSVAERAGQTSERVVLWQQAWAFSLMHPWIGSGWLQFGVDQARMAILFRPTGVSDYAHNIVLNLAVEIGWPATLLVLTSAAWWFLVNCLRRWRDPQVRFVALVLLAIAIHSMVEFPLWNTYVLLPFGVLVGAMGLPGPGTQRVDISRPWIVGFVIATTLAMGYVTWDYQRVVDGFRRLVKESTVPDPTQLPRYMPAFTLFPQFFDYLNVNKVKIEAGMPSSDIHLLERMSQSFAFPPILERLALAYALNKRPGEAVVVLTSEQRLNEWYYPKTYALWLGFAERDPALFGPIVQRLPVPPVLPNGAAPPVKVGDDD